MTNVISLGLPRRLNLAQRQSMLVESFVLARRPATDVYWLKENAELLNVLSTSGANLAPEALAPLSGFYAGLEERIRFFPQYYRFLLSMCLDLEDLGMSGDVGSYLCEYVLQQGLADAELSDLQRAEARYLLARRGVGLPFPGLDDRLNRFVSTSGTFALPNKKAAYELTHIVFYQSAYGQQAIAADEALITSLEFAGLLAFLDQDIDLLSEVCVALRFAGETPSDIWEDWLAAQLGGFHFGAREPQVRPDAYHEYLVSNWWSMLTHGAGFQGISRDRTGFIHRAGVQSGPLRAISECMYHMGAQRSRSWDRMQKQIAEALDGDGHSILEGAAQSSRHFDAFFSRFARAD